MRLHRLRTVPLSLGPAGAVLGPPGAVAGDTSIYSREDVTKVTQES
jgi:hypothetical protein